MRSALNPTIPSVFRVANPDFLACALFVSIPNPHRSHVSAHCRKSRPTHDFHFHPNTLCVKPFLFVFTPKLFPAYTPFWPCFLLSRQGFVYSCPVPVQREAHRIGARTSASWNLLLSTSERLIECLAQTSFASPRLFLVIRGCRICARARACARCRCPTNPRRCQNPPCKPKPPVRSGGPSPSNYPTPHNRLGHSHTLPPSSHGTSQPPVPSPPLPAGRSTR